MRQIERPGGWPETVRWDGMNEPSGLELAAIALYDVVMTPRRFLVIALIAAAALVACSVGQSPVSRDPHDPSSPAAVEGVDPLHPPTAKPATVASGTVYACPMHPEVTSSAPGTCPKCNMTLVPKK